MDIELACGSINDMLPSAFASASKSKAAITLQVFQNGIQLNTGRSLFSAQFGQPVTRQNTRKEKRVLIVRWNKYL